MKRLALELLVILASVASGVALGIAQADVWHLDSTGYLIAVFAIGAVALFVGLRIERRYPLNDKDRPAGAAQVQDHGAHRDQHTA